MRETLRGRQVVWYLLSKLCEVIGVVAVVDLGSNSFILLVQHEGETLLEEVYEVGLKSIGDEDEAFESASRVVSQIKAKVSDVPIHVFGTAIFREKPHLFERIVRKFGLKGEILSEEDEAYFTYMSVDPSFEKDITVFDLGGGSLEVVRKDWFMSLPLGTHVLNNLFDLSLPSIQQFEDALRHVEEMLPSFTNPVGIGGSFVAIASMRIGKWDLKAVEGLILTHHDVEAVIQQLRGNTFEQVRGWNIIPAGREKTIVAGCAVALAIAKRGSIKVSTKGFRHTLARMLEEGGIQRPWVRGR
ncbi:guanosine polyphosphate pyrophosphohydrolase [Pseudothermotoga hypogea DSM 11164 = NBRC 106472]|uniref:Guanosine polyphosphate pyrophosphohydrolase n=1 Tax=Pseudothermotoga hypogea DSM 11164 = NBRC 106472 TaxID=1123384 RepID=A0A0X1KU59_9THEM|nr:guanosine polyphosphate pyrophosphohydrolase [Pseudothermotoga hypogea]AJC74809.1 guanosine polyphosphate pyrophosphohydrolase [Pseudothermotoga hypogea DSM 11164 = NBRC 106472]